MLCLFAHKFEWTTHKIKCQYCLKSRIYIYSNYCIIYPLKLFINYRSKCRYIIVLFILWNYLLIIKENSRYIIISFIFEERKLIDFLIDLKNASDGPFNSNWKEKENVIIHFFSFNLQLLLYCVWLSTNSFCGKKPSITKGKNIHLSIIHNIYIYIMCTKKKHRKLSELVMYDYIHI